MNESICSRHQQVHPGCDLCATEFPACPRCQGTTYIWQHSRRRDGNSNRSMLPCPECQRGAWRITEWIEAVPERCGGRPTMRGTRLDVLHVISYLRRMSPAEMHAGWRHIPVEAFEHVKALVETGTYPPEFWEREYDPREVVLTNA